MLIDSTTKKITYSGMFWALGHFSRFVKRSARRIDSQSEAEGLYHCAFQNPDGSLVIVVTNPGIERKCQLQLADKVADVNLPANSVMTLQSAPLQRG
jgi:glucosylceramidase